MKYLVKRRIKKQATFNMRLFLFISCVSTFFVMGVAVAGWFSLTAQSTAELQAEPGDNDLKLRPLVY